MSLRLCNSAQIGAPEHATLTASSRIAIFAQDRQTLFIDMLRCLGGALVFDIHRHDAL